MVWFNFNEQILCEFGCYTWIFTYCCSDSSAKNCLVCILLFFSFFFSLVSFSSWKCIYHPSANEWKCLIVMHGVDSCSFCSCHFPWLWKRFMHLYKMNLNTSKFDILLSKCINNIALNYQEFMILFLLIFFEIWWYLGNYFLKMCLQALFDCFSSDKLIGESYWRLVLQKSCSHQSR